MKISLEEFAKRKHEREEEKNELDPFEYRRGYIDAIKQESYRKGFFDGLKKCRQDKESYEEKTLIWMC